MRNTITVTNARLAALVEFSNAEGYRVPKRDTGDTLVAIVDTRVNQNVTASVTAIYEQGLRVVGLDVISTGNSNLPATAGEALEVWADELACDWTDLACVAIEVEG